VNYATLRARIIPPTWDDLHPTISALHHFISAIDDDGFGTWTKVEYDVRVVQLLIGLGELPEDPTLHDLISRLNVTMTKAIRLQQALKA
jgi:hypothetical protein